MNDTARRGYPLAALFVLVTGCAALAAAVTPVLRAAFSDNLDNETLAIAIAASISGCVFLGALIGVLGFRWLVGASIGAAVGLAVGIVGGLLMMTPTNDLNKVAVSLVVGSGLMVGMALLLRPRK
jgi:hypothetical protein